MSVLDRLDGEFPHGLPAGYEQGCRGAGECPNNGTELLICREAWSRYRSDFAYKKLVDRGMSPVEIFAEENAALLAGRAAAAEAQRVAAEEVAEQERVRAERAAAREQGRLEREARKVERERARAERDQAKADRETRNAAAPDARPTPAPASASPTQPERPLTVREARAAVRAADLAVERARTALVKLEQAAKDAAALLDALLVKPAPRPRALQPHGTNAAYSRCRAAGAACGPCTVAHRKYFREYMASRKAATIPADRHGTPYGYQLGCKEREDCPASPSCADAARAEELRRRREQGIPAAPVLVDAGPVRDHVRGLMDAGVALLAVAERAGVPRSSVKTLMYGRAGRSARMAEEISAENAARLMAVRP